MELIIKTCDCDQFPITGGNLQEGITHVKKHGLFVASLLNFQVHDTINPLKLTGEFKFVNTELEDGALPRIFGSHDNLSIEQIAKFENENNVKLPDHYVRFLRNWNGGKVKPNLFKISDKQGPSVVNVFYGIGDMYDNLADFIEIMDERLPVGFIPIGDDPSGNVICLGTKEPYYDKIYFWDHEQEPEEPNDMRNMYLLANDITEFLDGLYRVTE